MLTPPPPLDPVYNAEYFGERMYWKAPVYKAMADALKEVYPKNTGIIIELGCGNGEFLQHFPYHVGIEGAQAGIDKCVERKLWVQKKDLREIFYVFTSFPMAVSIEVAEHIEPEYVDAYIHNLKHFSDLIVMTASPDPSEYHPNPQPREYWIEKMGDEYTENSEALRNAWKAVIPPEFDYLWKNLMVFERKN